MITTIAEHSVDLDLLGKKAKVLDLGCLGFQFTDEMRRLGHAVYPVDIQHMAHPVLEFYRCAISDYDGVAGIKPHPDKQAFTITEGNDVPCYTIPSFMQCVGVDFFDLIKMDIEGEEFKVIQSLTNAPAKQLSIEFHLHTGKYSRPEVALMVAKLKSLGYKTAKHELTEAHGCGFNYWDSLFIL